MGFTHEDFLDKKYYIKASSYEQVKMIEEYYPHERATVDIGNWKNYPYIFYDKKDISGLSGIHGNTGFHLESSSIIDFDDWAQFISEEDYDLEESEYDINFLIGMI